MLILRKHSNATSATHHQWNYRQFLHVVVAILLDVPSVMMHGTKAIPNGRYVGQIEHCLTLVQLMDWTI